MSAHTLGEEPPATVTLVEDAHTMKFPNALIEYGLRRLQEIESE